MYKKNISFLAFFNLLLLGWAYTLYVLTDINECMEFGADHCEDLMSSNHTMCKNSPGSYECTCTVGYIKKYGKCIGKLLKTLCFVAKIIGNSSIFSGRFFLFVLFLPFSNKKQVRSNIKS